MPDLETLVTQAQTGDFRAFGTLVTRFQDMAVGYAYSITGNFQTAEDAAQEAFMNAYDALSTLRTPQAFPGWLRRIVYKYCDRTIRKKQVDTVSFEEAPVIISPIPNPEDTMIEQETRDGIHTAITTLPEQERSAIVLFYIREYSHREIASFLNIPVKHVDHRLRAGRRRLKKRMLTMVQDTLQDKRPSNDTRFATKMMDGLTRVANQERFLDRLNDAFTSGSDRFGLVLYNIDYFKAFNDTHGHLAGDCLLSVLAKQAQSMIKKGDMVARYGNEEFTLLINRSSKEEVIDLANQLRETIATTTFHMEKMLRPEARLAAYDYALAPSPANDPYQQGVEHLQQDRLDEAKQAFEQAIVRDTNHVPAIMELEYLKARHAITEHGALPPPMTFTISGGLAYRRDEDTAETLLQRADARMRRAKAGGRNQICSDNG